MNSSSRNRSTATPDSGRKPGASTFNRRSFVKRVLATGAAANLGALALKPGQRKVQAAEISPGNVQQRRAQAYQVRVQAAQLAIQRGVVSHPTNGDEELYPNQLGSFTKALPHNALGEVDLNAYNVLLRALATGRQQDFAAIPIGLGAKLTNPQSGLAFD